MEEIPKKCLEGAAGEQIPNVLIKEEMEWLAEDAHAPSPANQEEELDMESLRSIKTVEDPYHIDKEAHAVQEFAPVPQTDEYIKAELVLDEEFIDMMSDSEENCKQFVQPLDHDQQTKISKSDKEVCGSSLTQKANLNIQVHPKHREKAQSSKKAFRCDLCERTFSVLSNLRRHKDVHTRRVCAEFKTFNCEVCNSRFTEKGNLKKHMLRKHLDQVQLNAPGPQTADDDAIDSDMKEFLDGGPIQLTAAQCNEIQADKKRHLSTHDKDSKNAFSCDLCRRTFSHLSNLRRHKDVHTRRVCAEFKTFNCEVCNSRFTEKGNLKKHMLRKHLDAVKFNLSGPQTAHHNSIDSNMKEFLDGGPIQLTAAQCNEIQSDKKGEACEVCHCIFPTGYMRRHMGLAHYKEKYECGLCSHVFNQKHNLESHLRTHATNRKRDIVCDICERTFYEKKHLRAHKRRFAQKDHPKFNCKRCLSSFTRKGDLNVHMHAKHLNKSQPIASAPQTAGHDSREQRLTPVPSKDAGVCIKTELMSDEEFIVERNERDSVSSPTDTTDPPTANEDSVHAKEELTSDEEFLDEGT